MPARASRTRRALRHGASGAGSTGPGLDIVRRVAESASGRLVIDRSPMRGARIATLLDAVPDHTAPRPALSPAPFGPTSAEAGQPGTVTRSSITLSRRSPVTRTVAGTTLGGSALYPAVRAREGHQVLPGLGDLAAGQ
ncbi:hypothetical protein GCM10010199_51380 [Dactylosporangium roseum]